MKRLPIAVCLVFATLVLSHAPEAQAKKGFALITFGDDIQDLGPAQNAPAELGAGANVGYFQSEFGVFWVNIWTWDGTFCVFRGDTYEPISQQDATRYLGKEAEVPFTYSFPPGFLILLFLGASFLFSVLQEKKKAAAFMEKVRAERAAQESAAATGTDVDDGGEEEEPLS